VSLARLESDLLKVRKDLGVVREVNNRFNKVIDEIELLKRKTMTDPQTKEAIINELKNKELIDVFAGIEHDFEDLKQQLAKQEISRERISDFVESLRTKKTFSFTETTKSIIFLEQIVDQLKSSHITIKPEFVGTMDLGSLAIELGLYKTSSGVIVEKERFASALASLLGRKLLKNLIFETDNAKIFLRASTEVTVETDNSHLKEISRLARE
jgi:site-specific DNA-adenine methylase